jgi:hypothetical protein
MWLGTSEIAERGEGEIAPEHVAVEVQSLPGGAERSVIRVTSPR